MYDYFYGAEADQFSFYRIPKVLFTEERFQGISAEAKVLYGLLLDRMSLSARNGWLDAEGRVYIIFSVEDIMTAMGCANQKAGKLLYELESKCSLIERKRQGLGKPNLIYVKNFVTYSESHFKKCENHDFCDIVRLPKGGDDMQKENELTVGRWCNHWFTANRRKWNGNTEGGYRNLIYSHIIPSIGSVALSDLTKQTITDFYDSLRSQGLGARSVWCVHLLLRRCLDEAALDQLIPSNPVRLCQEPKAEEYKTAPLRSGQLQRYLNAAEQLGVLPLIYTGLSSGLRQCELITLSWADFHVRYKYILRGQRLLTLNDKAAYFLKQIPETGSPYVFLNAKTGAPYKLHEFYYLHKKNITLIIKNNAKILFIKEVKHFAYAPAELLAKSIFTY